MSTHLGPAGLAIQYRERAIRTTTAEQIDDLAVLISKLHAEVVANRPLWRRVWLWLKEKLA